MSLVCSRAWKTVFLSLSLTDGLELVLRKPVACLGERAVLLRC